MLTQSIPRYNLPDAFLSRSSMLATRCSRTISIAISLSFLAILPFLSLTSAQILPGPWSATQTVQPADLIKELADTSSAPTVLYVGFQRLYTAGHIKGAQFHGSGGSAEGLAQLKSWAAALPRSTNLVIYCGCCPLERCPNLRPAFTALHEMGFTKLRALMLPTSFAEDWAAKGLPVEKAQ
jgi:thiosulfate/3-mercaptopyruvate sulfurtransferase